MALLKESDPINFIGTRVLVRSNEEGPCLEGILVRWDTLHSNRFSIVRDIEGVDLVRWDTLHSNQVPIVRDEQGIDWICFGVLLPFNSSLQTFLDSLPYREAYELASDISILNQARFRRE